MLFYSILVFILLLNSATFLLNSLQDIKLCRGSLSDMWVKIIAWCVDIVTCGLSMRSMHTTSHSTTTTKTELGMVPSLWVCIWHTGTMGSRLLIVTVGASMWPEETLQVCFFLWAASLVWLYWMADAREAFCLKKTDIFREVFCSSVVALVYLLTFVNLKRGSTFCRQSVYFIVNLIVNIICVYVIRSYTTHSESHTLIAIYLVILFLYIVGYIAMVYYYTQQHPTWTFKACLKSFCKSFKNFGCPLSSEKTDEAGQSDSSQDTETDDDFTPLHIPAIDKLFCRFDVVFNKLLDWIGPIPMHRSILKEVVVPGQNNIPLSSSLGSPVIEHTSSSGSASEHD